MSKKVFNLSRREVRSLTLDYIGKSLKVESDFTYGEDSEQLNINDNLAWISIQEPGEESSVVNHADLTSIPQLHLAFWDTTIPVVSGDETFNPPTKEHAKQIVDFLIQHKDRNIIVNCAAGISRSGAIASFCSNTFGHQWDRFGRSRAIPNFRLVQLMEEYYNIDLGNNAMYANQTFYGQG